MTIGKLLKWLHGSDEVIVGDIISSFGLRGQVVELLEDTVLVRLFDGAKVELDKDMVRRLDK